MSVVAIAPLRLPARVLRRTAVHAGLVAAVLAVGCLALMLGDYRLTVGQVLGALAGDPGPAHFVVVELRAPRWVLGVLVGLAFGVSGALFQTSLRNPLASPDVLGVSQGASAAAVATLLVGGASGWAMTAAAAGGGVLVGVLLYAVAWKQGTTGQRFVLSGIGVAYLAGSVVGYLLTRSDVRDAQAALTWMTGSLGQSSWQLVQVLGPVLLVLLPLAAILARGLDLLQLGDDRAASLGRRPEVVRGGAVLLGVLLASAATAAAGPVAFVAFAAAPIARRLLGDGTPGLAASGLVGVVLVTASDVVAQHLLPVDVPVGIVTGALGAPVLIWLLARRRTS